MPGTEGMGDGCISYVDGIESGSVLDMYAGRKSVVPHRETGVSQNKTGFVDFSREWSII